MMEGADRRVAGTDGLIGRKACNQLLDLASVGAVGAVEPAQSPDRRPHLIRLRARAGRDGAVDVRLERLRELADLAPPDELRAALQAMRIPAELVQHDMDRDVLVEGVVEGDFEPANGLCHARKPLGKLLRKGRVELGTQVSEAVTRVAIRHAGIVWPVGRCRDRWRMG
jgi:hypothetical protein